MITAFGAHQHHSGLRRCLYLLPFALDRWSSSSTELTGFCEYTEISSVADVENGSAQAIKDPY
jgi:hypothetical protein